MSISAIETAVYTLAFAAGKMMKEVVLLMQETVVIAVVVADVGQQAGIQNEIEREGS